MKTILILNLILTIWLIALHFRLHKRFSIKKGVIIYNYDYDYVDGFFSRGKYLFRVIPRFFYKRSWTFYYNGYNCQFVRAYTKSGAIKKLTKIYDINKFNLARVTSFRS